MDEKKLRAILKPCMALIILLLAYFLPQLALREDPGGRMDQIPAEEMTETGEETRKQRGLIILDPGHGGYR